jgi:hypothetical protein
LNSLLQLDHLSYKILNGGRPVETMRVPKVNSLNTKTIEALLASNRHVCGITTEFEARRQQDGAELGGEEDILPLLGVQGNPFADDDFCIALHAGC